ncbi:MAG TPA: CopG family transcriptional regulator [Gemmatimonadaceae bacterium]|nr:CopG family transcriptional regulator [Gemmatimonadaceae bacterium]
MKDSHLTLRLTAAISRALDRLSHERGIPKSQVVREALAMYMVPRAPESTPVTITAAELAEKWNSVPVLDAAEAHDFSEDIKKARRTLPPARPAWK